MNVAQFVVDYWPIFTATFFTVVWLVRLEMQVIFQKQKIEDESKARADLEERIGKQRSEDLVNSQRSFDKIDSKLDSMWSDLRSLMKGS